eukprot:31411-Pelagococcus_subviridis.AAC.13
MRSDTYALIHSDRSRPRRRPSPRGGGGGGALPNLLKRSRRARRVPATVGSLRDGVGAEKISASGWDKRGSAVEAERRRTTGKVSTSRDRPTHRSISTGSTAPPWRRSPSRSDSPAPRANASPSKNRPHTVAATHRA